MTLSRFSPSLAVFRDGSQDKILAFGGTDGQYGLQNILKQS